MVRAAAANGQFSNQGRVSSNDGRIISFFKKITTKASQLRLIENYFLGNRPSHGDHLTVESIGLDELYTFVFECETIG